MVSESNQCSVTRITKERLNYVYEICYENTTLEIFVLYVNNYKHGSGVEVILSHTFKSKVVPAHAMKEYKGKGGIAPLDNESSP
jgi:hypothetical protein